MTKVIQRIGIIGAGAWGTALATVARRAGRDVTIWAHEADVVDAINKTHENPLFLPDIPLDAAIVATNDLARVTDTDAVLVVTPAQFMRTITTAAAIHWKPGVPALVCAKGIEQETGALMGDVLAETLPDVQTAVLSGPTFAAEVARDLPTAVTLAATDDAIAGALAEAIGTRRFRIYQSKDPIGVEVAGAVKNVMAIACGIVEGCHLGDNARAALITRGLAEIARLTVALGGSRETLMGLSGLGDLTLTCNAMQSRNFSLGVALGEGASLSDILDQRTSVAEGVFTAASVAELTRRLGVEMPICTAIDGILHHYGDIAATINSLLARPFKSELHFEPNENK